MITLGVEEEFLLVDSASGLPVPLAGKVRAAAGLQATLDTGEVQSELLQAQVEVATPVCGDLVEVVGHLRRLRHAVSTAAESFGCRLAACGAAPVRTASPVPVTESSRYLSLRAQAPQLVAEQLINGMHVHVGVPDRATGVEVLGRIRVWLPTLLAMAANSPYWDGRDTGFASWRTMIFGRWPVSGPPPRFESLDDHEQRVKALLNSGVIGDTRQIYWQARVSDHYPTVEIRCPDVQLRTDEAALVAGVARALVATALRETEAGLPLPVCPPELLKATDWHAARHGLGGSLPGPDGRPRDVRHALRRLLEHIGPALAAAGDTEQVTSLVEGLLRDGNGADRQRRAHAEGGTRALVDLVTEQTLA
ncbi:carboxylate-amine ligase [Streptomyces antimicrobicus]|uniref:Putative glutamate--cysteine ligase 2 n=1 Tax=Streptomyces antimicrobicus TaxID=2883108 RepID=A0ABS8BF97_9ACTN|nr:glutamate--cysteine ligase [Streptomyces antimicrobicus]MCB5183297.1 glutamate--cysteine ligase [Streptomyces antimicrobicus]